MHAILRENGRPIISLSVSVQSITPRDILVQSRADTHTHARTHTRLHMLLACSTSLWHFYNSVFVTQHGNTFSGKYWHLVVNHVANQSVLVCMCVCERESERREAK